IQTLQEIYDDVGLKVWARQPEAFFAEALLDMDGTLVATTGACKQGMDIAHDGTWGYHPLLVSLANTGEVLRLVNRPANRPSHEGAAAALDACLALCFRGGFERVLLRGDTDFSQTAHLDRWNADGRVQFVFGYDAHPSLVDKAERVPERFWQELERPPRYAVKTQPRQRPEAVKDAVVKARQFETLRLQ